MTQSAEPALRLLSPKESESKTSKALEPSTFRSARELIETLAIALFLSILFKFFEAEAYVIPTGSMAPTLMGRHKDVCCDQCGFPFQVSASDEMDNETNRPSGVRTEAGTCPQCGYTQYFPSDVPSYKGDRVVVNKCIPEMRETRRWDVSVFRCPADPRNNYIKRIVGLPEENLRVQYGDLFVRKSSPDGTVGTFEIARKPLANLLEMLQTVYDNDYQPKRLLERGWPPRWTDDLSRTDAGQVGWQAADGGRGFYFSGKPVPQPSETVHYRATQTDVPVAEPAEGEENFQWIRYRHIVPSSEDWFYALADVSPTRQASDLILNNPQLVTDHTAYNTGLSKNELSSVGGRFGEYVRPLNDAVLCRKSPDGFGFNWIGDLGISCELAFGEFSEGQQILLELVKGGTAFRARLELSAGTVSLEIPSVAEYRSETAAYAFRPNRTLRVLFLNVDEQMRLILDGREIAFPNEGKYDHLCQELPGALPGLLPRNRDPNLLDLTPAAIGAVGGPVEASRLKILRDIYYIAMGVHVEPAETLVSRTGAGERLVGSRNRRCDRFFSEPVQTTDELALAEFLSQPKKWKNYGNTRSALFELGKGQYLAFGDNSGLSLDSRLWESENIPFYVKRELMLGKAVCVYWPHGKPIPGTSLPFVPNFAKMRKID